MSNTSTLRTIPARIRDPQTGAVLDVILLRSDMTAWRQDGREVEGFHEVNARGWHTFRAWAHPCHAIAADWEVDRLVAEAPTVEAKLAVLRQRGHCDAADEDLDRVLLGMGCSHELVEAAVVWERMDEANLGN